MITSYKTIHTYSPRTRQVCVVGVNMDIPLRLHKHLDLKSEQCMKSWVKRDPEEYVVLFSFGVLPHVKDRDGTYEPAGVVLLAKGRRKIIHIPKFKGNLKTLVKPQVFTQYA